MHHAHRNQKKDTTNKIIKYTPTKKPSKKVVPRMKCYRNAKVRHQKH